MLNLNHYRRPRASRVVKASIVVAACVIGLVTWDFLGACGCGSASQAAGLHRVVGLNGLGMLCESVWGKRNGLNAAISLRPTLTAAESDAGRDCRGLVSYQDHVSRFDGELGSAAPHCYSRVSGGHRWSVVEADWPASRTRRQAVT